jgi:hypothetical protein
MIELVVFSFNPSQWIALRDHLFNGGWSFAAVIRAGLCVADVAPAGFALNSCRVSPERAKAALRRSMGADGLEASRPLPSWLNCAGIDESQLEQVP